LFFIELLDNLPGRRITGYRSSGISVMRLRWLQQQKSTNNAKASFRFLNSIALITVFYQPIQTNRAGNKNLALP
jgi:hypothetical protein